VEEDLDFAFVDDTPSLSIYASVAGDSTSTSSATALSNSAGGSASSTDPAKFRDHDLSALPDDPILQLLTEDDNPHHIRPPSRLPQNTHPGNDGSSQPTFTLAKSQVRYYHTSASTFIDLVDDPLLSDWQGTQRLRLRAGSRRLGSPLVYPPEHPTLAGCIRPPSNDLTTALEEMYRVPPIRYWPPPQDSTASDPRLEEIYSLMNPPTHLGNVEGTADERSLVYLTGARNAPQAIIFLSFDPAIKLVGLKTWGGMTQKGVGEGPHIEGRASGTGAGSRDSGADVGKDDRTVGIELGSGAAKRKGKEKPTNLGYMEASLCGGQAIVDVHGNSGNSPPGDMGARKCNSWAWVEKAMYQDIGLGLYLGL